MIAFRVTGLTVSYGPVVAVRDLGFSVESGEANRAVHGLRALGLKRGDTIAAMTTNEPANTTSVSTRIE